MTNHTLLRTYKALVSSLLLTGLTLAFSAPAFAGVDGTAGTPGNCFLSGSTEICYGSMAGIRNQTSDPGRYASFGYSSAGTSYFYMLFNNVSYYCNAPSSMNDAIKTAMASSGYFVIYYDVNSGICSYLALQTGSELRNASAL